MSGINISLEDANDYITGADLPYSTDLLEECGFEELRGIRFADDDHSRNLEDEKENVALTSPTRQQVLQLMMTRIGPDMCLKMSLFGQPWFCLIFILSKNKGFQPGTLQKMPTSSPFHGRILLRYSETNKYLTYFSKNNKNNLKKNAGFKGNFKYKEAFCFIGYSL